MSSSVDFSFTRIAKLNLAKSRISLVSWCPNSLCLAAVSCNSISIISQQADNCSQLSESPIWKPFTELSVSIHIPMPHQIRVYKHPSLMYIYCLFLEYAIGILVQSKKNSVCLHNRRCKIGF